VSAALTYLPAYIGLYLALLLGIACNAFLDIWYGSFGVEVVIWAVIFAYTLSVGWRQEGQVSDFGRDRQKAVLVVGILVTVLIDMVSIGLIIPVLPLIAGIGPEVGWIYVVDDACPERSGERVRAVIQPKNKDGAAPSSRPSSSTPAPVLKVAPGIATPRQETAQ